MQAEAAHHTGLHGSHGKSHCMAVAVVCCNSRHHQPNTSTSLHLCIDGFSCCYQLMALAGLFIPIIPFLNHMILFSDFPLTSLPSFLYNSLTTQLCIFLFLLYLVMFISHSSDIVPHLSATSELTIYRFCCAQFASHSQVIEPQLPVLYYFQIFSYYLKCPQLYPQPTYLQTSQSLILLAQTGSSTKSNSPMPFNRKVYSAISMDQMFTHSLLPAP